MLVQACEKPDQGRGCCAHENHRFDLSSVPECPFLPNPAPLLNQSFTASYRVASGRIGSHCGP